MHQSAAVIGIALITLGEPVGQVPRVHVCLCVRGKRCHACPHWQEMAERMYQHLLQYGDMAVRRAVPLAMALSHVSDPDYALIDVLSKLSHDQDGQTAMNAILALGLFSAGTNNSRVAGILRQLATFYAKDTNLLFVVRLSQGLLHSGKGLVTLSPLHSDKLLLSYPALAGLLTVLYTSLDMEATILSKQHYLLYTLACAIRPRMLFAVDEDMEPLSVNVRVGQAVETVGQAGARRASPPRPPPRALTLRTQATPRPLRASRPTAPPCCWRETTAPRSPRRTTSP